jgi:hypothetical protein
MRTRWLLAPVVVASLLAFAGPIAAQSAKWWAVAVLEGGDSKVCGGTDYTKFEVEMNGGLLKTRLASGSPNTFRLQAPLKPDGSGKVIGLNDKNRPSTFNFDAGAGPRVVRVMPPYSPCVWIWRPISRG